MKKAQGKKLPKATAKAKPKAAAKAGPAMNYATRADLGAPIDGFFAKQPPAIRAILEALRRLVDEVAPEASSSLKWGMPFYTLDGKTMCALAAFKSHVNLILSGPPATSGIPFR